MSHRVMRSALPAGISGLMVAAVAFAALYHVPRREDTPGGAGEAPLPRMNQPLARGPTERVDSTGAIFEGLGRTVGARLVHNANASHVVFAMYQFAKPPSVGELIDKAARVLTNEIDRALRDLKRNLPPLMVQAAQDALFDEDGLGVLTFRLRVREAYRRLVLDILRDNEVRRELISILGGGGGGGGSIAGQNRVLKRKLVGNVDEVDGWFRFEVAYTPTKGFRRSGDPLARLEHDVYSQLDSSLEVDVIAKFETPKDKKQEVLVVLLRGATGPQHRQLELHLLKSAAKKAAAACVLIKVTETPVQPKAK